MKKFLFVLTLISILALLLAGTALANHQGDPVGGCPDGFELHHIGDHDHHEGEHHHIGNDTDRNGDGYLCMKHVGADESNHVHIDNNVPLD
jgi:hypothetical protein